MMLVRRTALGLFAALCVASAASAGPAREAINTNGSDKGVAISGFDTVAFFTEHKAVQGKETIAHEWKGARWLFSSPAHLALFKADPEKYAPQWGGFCAVGVSEGHISKKVVNGEFDIRDGKLYLFPVGRDGSHDGIKKEWFELKGGPQSRVAAGSSNWPGLKTKYEAP